MKLRIHGNSLRLRVSRSDVARLLRDGRIEETIHFAPDAGLTYALQHAPSTEPISLKHSGQTVTVLLSTEAATRWAGSDEVGIYGHAESGNGPLELLVEKDFACIGGAHPSDEDAFPNPKADPAC